MAGAIPGPPDLVWAEQVQFDISRLCGELHVNPGQAGRAARRHMRGRIDIGDAGRFQAVTVALDAEWMARDSKAVRRDPRDHHYLVLQQQGRSVVEQDGLPVMLQAGDLCLVDSTRPMKVSYGCQLARQVSLHMPREELDHRFRARGRPRFVVQSGDPLGIPMRSILDRMMDADAAEARELGEAFLGLMGAWYAARSAGDRAGADHEAARRVIARRAGDPAFGPGELAAELGLSPRALQRQFQAIGETPGRAIAEERLSRAMARLAGSGEPIAGIAFDCGFNDLSHFYREFRRRYGKPPGEVRRDSLSHFSKSLAQSAKPGGGGRP